MINKKYLFLILTLFVISCSNIDNSTTDDTILESTATGILEVESYPRDAQIFVDGELKASSPTTLYNIPAISHEVTIRKEGFEDFETTVIIQAGRIEEIKATLIPKELEEEIIIEETPIKDTTEESTEELKETPDDTVTTDELKETSDDKTPIFQGNIEIPEFFEYIDVNTPEASTFNQVGTDLLSKNYGEYLHITAINNAFIVNVDKPLIAVESNDCVPIQSVIGALFSDKSICVKTSDGSLYAVGGSWDEKPTSLLVIPLD